MTANAIVSFECGGCGEHLVLGAGDFNTTCSTCYKITLRSQVEPVTHQAPAKAAMPSQIHGGRE